MDNREKDNIIIDSEALDTSDSSLNSDKYIGVIQDDPALDLKLQLINDALEEIGFTPYHLKLFFLNGMGYATDSQLTLLESSVRTYVNYQFSYEFPVSAVVFYGGLLVGSIFWGFGADLIGRKTAFNLSLLLSSIMTICTGAMGTFATYCLFVFFISFFAGGNLVLDTCVFLEYLPRKNQWLLTFFALFWGVGQTIAVLTAWAFLPHNSCTSIDNCPSSLNKGWRYVYYVNGAIVLVLAILRLTVVRLKETPKYLVSNNRDQDAVDNLQQIAKKYNRPCSLTFEQLKACGDISTIELNETTSFANTWALIKKHLGVLFQDKKSTLSSTLLFSSWLLLGIAYPLYSSFLPEYLASRGASTTERSVHDIYRDDLISNSCSTIGPMISGALLYFVPILGQKGVLIIGGVSTMALLFGYTAVRTNAQNVGLSAAVYAVIFMYYGCLYAYSPMIMPSSARATGNSICFACTRIASCFVPVISWYADTTTSVPIWICGSLLGVIGCSAWFFPYDPAKQIIL